MRRLQATPRRSTRKPLHVDHLCTPETSPRNIYRARRDSLQDSLQDLKAWRDRAGHTKHENNRDKAPSKLQFPEFYGFCKQNTSQGLAPFKVSSQVWKSSLYQDHIAQTLESQQVTTGLSLLVRAVSSFLWKPPVLWHKKWDHVRAMSPDVLDVSCDLLCSHLLTCALSLSLPMSCAYDLNSKRFSPNKAACTKSNLCIILVLWGMTADETLSPFERV